MLSEQHLLGNLQALAGAGTPAPPLGHVDPDQVRAVDHDGHLAVAFRGVNHEWIVLAGDERGASEMARLSRADASTFCLIGTRAGCTIEAVETRRPDARIVAIEPEPSHALILLARRDWREAIDSGRLTILVGPDYPGASSAARRVDLSAAPFVFTDPLLALHRTSAVRAAGTTLARMLGEARANLEARRAFAPRYLLQTLQNLPVLTREGDAAALDGAFEGTPAVIVGAGPSLDENAGPLAQVGDRAVVIAADTTLGPLEAAGIAPPIVVAVDPSEWNARHLAAPRDVSETWLVAEGSLHPTVFSRFAGRTFGFEVSGHEPWPWLAAHGMSRGRLRAWGSVVTSAFDLALRMRCNPIVFAGLDLAFTGGRTYCRHTAHEEIWGKWIENGDTWENVWAYLVSQQPQQTVPDLAGRPAITTPYLVAFRNWLVEQIAAAPEGTRFVNATGAGLLYGPRIEQASLRDALSHAPVVLRTSIHELLRAAHGACKTQRAPIAAAVSAAARLLRRESTSPLEQCWHTFTAGQLDRPLVVRLLTAAAESLNHD